LHQPTCCFSLVLAEVPTLLLMMTHADDVTTRSAFLSGRFLSRLHPPDDVIQTPSPWRRL